MSAAWRLVLCAGTGIAFWACNVDGGGLEIRDTEAGAFESSIDVSLGPNDRIVVEAGGAAGPDAFSVADWPDQPPSTGGVGGALGGTGTGGIAGSSGQTSTSGVVGDGGVGGAGGLAGTATSGSIEIGGTLGAGGALGTGGVTVGTGGATIGSGGTAAGGTTTCVLGPFQTPELITGLGRDSMDLFGPSISADGTTLYFAGNYLNTPDDIDDIFVATRIDRGVQFSTAIPLDSVNTPSADGSPAISNDGLTLYFYSKRPYGLGGRDLWSASRATLQSTFQAASTMMLAALNSPDDDNLPWISADELTIVFSSTRSGGSDLYIATRPSRWSPFLLPRPIGGINDPTTREDRAALSADGLSIYFVSDRAGGLGDKDIWVATRNSQQADFGGATDLEVVNTSQRDIDVALSADQRELFFASRRSGQFRLYRSLRECQ